VVVVRSSTGAYRIEILSVRGRTIRRLVKSSTPLANPDWSPNGREVVFAKQRPDGRFQLYAVGLLEF
jgi:Tol biopolymer transport system component